MAPPGPRGPFARHSSSPDFQPRPRKAGGSGASNASSDCGSRRSDGGSRRLGTERSPIDPNNTGFCDAQLFSDKASECSGSNASSAFGSQRGGGHKVALDRTMHQVDRRHQADRISHDAHVIREGYEDDDTIQPSDLRTVQRDLTRQEYQDDGPEPSPFTTAMDRGMQDEFDARRSRWEDINPNGTPRGATPRREADEVTTSSATHNPPKRDNSVGANEGYHGARPQRDNVTNRRLFGLGPCQRSSVDEVVFGRDLDFSTGRAHNAELNTLLCMYKGAAGSKNAMAELVPDLPGQECPGPDDDRKLCMKSGASIQNIGWDGFAGLKTRSQRDTKRAWMRLPLQKSSVAESVFGYDTVQLHGHDKAMLRQFEHCAGFSPRLQKQKQANLCHQRIREEAKNSPSPRSVKPSLKGSMGNIAGPGTSLKSELEPSWMRKGRIYEPGAHRRHHLSFHVEQEEIRAAGKSHQKDTNVVYCVYH